jgi:hypothetical protein
MLARVDKSFRRWRWIGCFFGFGGLKVGGNRGRRDR